MIEISKITQSKSVFRSPESSWTFLEIFNDILRNFFQPFCGFFLNISRNLFENLFESSQTFPGIFLNIPLNLFSRKFWNENIYSKRLAGISVSKASSTSILFFIHMLKKDASSKVISGNTTMISFLSCPIKYFPKI